MCRKSRATNSRGILAAARSQATLRWVYQQNTMQTCASLRIQGIDVYNQKPLNYYCHPLRRIQFRRCPGWDRCALPNNSK